MYAVEFVDDDRLPAGQDWVLARTARTTVLFLKASALCPRVLEEAWAGYRELARRQTAPFPAQRVPTKAVALRV